MFQLAVEEIASWVGVKMKHSVEDEMLTFCQSSMFALSKLCTQGLHCWDDTQADMRLVEQEAVHAGFSRCGLQVLVVLLWC